MTDGLYLDAELFDLTAQRPIHPRSEVHPIGSLFPGFIPNGRLCDCCSHIWRETAPGRSQPHRRPAVARWEHPHGHASRLCLECLNGWFDNADDDPDLEPVAWSWLPGMRPEQPVPA